MSIRIGLNAIDRSLILHHFRVYRRFLDLLEPQVDESLKAWEKAIEQEASHIEDEEERDLFYDFHSDEYHDQVQFRVILFNSFFASVFALFEHQLVRACNRAQRQLRNPISVMDLGHPSLTERAKKYLPKLGISFPSKIPEWQEICRYREIRNKIMHEGGKVPPKGKVTDYVKQKGLVSSGEIELNRAFCDEALKNMENFLIKVNYACEEGLKKRNKPRS